MVGNGDNPLTVGEGFLDQGLLFFAQAGGQGDPVSPLVQGLDEPENPLSPCMAHGWGGKLLVRDQNADRV